MKNKPRVHAGFINDMHPTKLSALQKLGVAETLSDPEPAQEHHLAGSVSGILVSDIRPKLSA